MEHLESALAAHPRVVLRRGEPGIGKTRMAEELTELAATRGVPAAWGPAAESSGAPPYWPWRQVLRGVSASVDVVTIADKLGLTSDLVRLAPDVFDAPSRDRSGSGSSEDRFRLLLSCSTTRTRRITARCCASFGSRHSYGGLVIWRLDPSLMIPSQHT